MDYMEKIVEMLDVDLNEKFELKTKDNYTLDGVYYFNHNYELIKCDNVNGKIVAPNSDLVDILRGYYEIKMVPYIPKDGETFYYPINKRDAVIKEKFDSNNVLHLALRALGITYEKESYARKNFPTDYETLTGKDYFDFGKG